MTAFPNPGARSRGAGNPGVFWPRAVFVAIAGGLVLVWSLKVGGVQVTWSQLLHDHTLLYSLRVPRVLMAAMVGALLAAVGSVLQVLFRNPLADPYLLGVSSGAALGAVLGVVLGLFPPLLAALGALVSLSCVIALARLGKTVSVTMMVLAGAAVHSFSSAVLTFILSQVSGRFETSGIFFWLLGSLDALSYRTLLPLAAASAGGLLLLFLLAPALNVLTQGEESAQSLGLDVNRAKWMLVSLSAALCGLAVSFNGMIPFVGLIVPHITRLLFGADHRISLPMSGFMGAILVAAADALGRSFLAPQEIPTGVVTSLLGAPFFLWILRREKSKVI